MKRRIKEKQERDNLIESTVNSYKDKFEFDIEPVIHYLDTDTGRYFGGIDKNRDFHGYGSLTTFENVVYEGKFINGIPDGIFRITFNESIVSYFRFKNGMLEFDEERKRFDKLKKDSGIYSSCNLM